MSHRHGFTLVELLVVIGIIALLISILLPVLGSARRQAAKTKCAAQMRELCNSMLMYAQDNKGYLPCPRVSTPYDINGLLFDKGNTETPGKIVDENAKWWHFLGKYLSKQSPMAQSAREAGAIQKGIFWCPSFPGYLDSPNAPNPQGEVNRNYTGIGMNWWPSFRTDYPPSALNANGMPDASEKFADATSTGNTRGTWYKLAQYTHPAERALLADSRYWYVEARGVKAGQTIPGQRLNFINNTYSGGATGRSQAMFDFYRHGKYPPVENPTPAGGHYRAGGGTIGYNILFADGHVESPTDREIGYRACRMRFPEP